MGIQFGPLLIGIAVASLSLAVFMGLFFLGYRLLTEHGSRRAMERLEGPAVAPEGGVEASPGTPSMQRLLEAMGRWLGGYKLLAGEDARLLRQAGYRKPNAVHVFTAIRFLLPIGLALGTTLFWHLMGYHAGMGYWLALIAAAIVGYLVPKLFLESRAAGRRERLNGELPFFVDMIALLQGVGLSLEQSLFALGQASDLGLPVLTEEMGDLNRQIAAGRPRLEAMQRMSQAMDDEDLSELVSVLRQIERYGGDVADTLRATSDRLQEKRRMLLRERVGKLTVKMTAVMILTMLPALLMITAGPGFLAIIRFLNTVG